MSRIPHLKRFWIPFGILTVLIAGSCQFLPDPWGIITAIGLPIFALIIIGIWLRPYWVVVFLTFFIPLESFLLKFTPGPEQVFFAAQFLSEILVYFTFALVALKHVLRGKWLPRTPVDVSLTVFLAGAAVSIFLNQTPLVTGLLTLRTLLRFAILYYLVIGLDLQANQIRRLLQVILLVGALEVAVGVVQLAGGSTIKDYFLPRQSKLSFLGETRNLIMITRGRELGSIFGTLGDTLYLGLFMLTVLAIYISGIRKFKPHDLIVIAIIVTTIGFSYSRAALLGSLVMLMIWYVRFYRRIKPTVIGVAISLPLTLLLILIVIGIGSSAASQQYLNPRFAQANIVDNITSIFSERYLEIVQKQRLGSVSYVPPVILREKPFFGYGPDQDATIERLNHTEIATKYKTLKTQGFEDVYWVALLAYYGVVGVAAIAAIQGVFLLKAWKIFWQTHEPLLRCLAIATSLTMILSPLLLFFYRALEFRTYSFYFWLLPALLFNMQMRHSSQAHLQNKSRPQP